MKQQSLLHDTAEEGTAKMIDGIEGGGSGKPRHGRIQDMRIAARHPIVLVARSGKTGKARGCAGLGAGDQGGQRKRRHSPVWSSVEAPKAPDILSDYRILCGDETLESR